MTAPAAADTRIEIRPQAGPQEFALAVNADIVIIGGSKGGGKSWVARMAPVPHLAVPGFHAVIFRRTEKQHTKPGGQWDKSFEIYPYLWGKAASSKLRWHFPSGASIAFSHLQQQKHALDWQGTETTMFIFDQLEEFERQQFLKILGCNRSTCGVQTQIWATANPEADTWLAEFLEPWLAADGYLNVEEDRSIKYFTVVDDEFVWVDADWRDANGMPAKSVCYINAEIWDNPILLEQDPGYLSNLQNQSLVDRERYLGQRGRGGNWKIKACAGKVFRADWFPVFSESSELPGLIARGQLASGWDFASTPEQLKGKDSDFTTRCKLLRLHPQDSERLGYKGIVLHAYAERLGPAEQDKAVLTISQQDGHHSLIRWQRDPGSAGVKETHHLRTLLQGWNAVGLPSNQSKYQRAKAASRAVEKRQIAILSDASWNQRWLNQLSQFPDGAHDDEVDGFTNAYNALFPTGQSGTVGVSS